jgi:hypothetical protein
MHGTPVVATRIMGMHAWFVLRFGTLSLRVEVVSLEVTACSRDHDVQQSCTSQVKE